MEKPELGISGLAHSLWEKDYIQWMISSGTPKATYGIERAELQLGSEPLYVGKACADKVEEP